MRRIELELEVGDLDSRESAGVREGGLAQVGVVPQEREGQAVPHLQQQLVQLLPHLATSQAAGEGSSGQLPRAGCSGEVQREVAGGGRVERERDREVAIGEQSL